MQHDHQRQCFHQRRYAYSQLRVTSLYPTKREMKDIGNIQCTAAQLMVHQDKLYEDRMTESKIQAPTCLILPRNAWFVLPLCTCQELLWNQYKLPRSDETTNKTMNQMSEQSWNITPPKVKFNTRYNMQNSCTWRILCQRGNYNEQNRVTTAINFGVGH